MIGHLQSNKAAKAAELFGAVDSVDSVKLAERLNAAAASIRKEDPGPDRNERRRRGSKERRRRRTRRISKHLLLAAPRFEALGFRGLMTVPPFTDDPEGARPYFRRLREIRDTIASTKASRHQYGSTFDGNVSRLRSGYRRRLDLRAGWNGYFRREHKSLNHEEHRAQQLAAFSAS